MIFFELQQLSSSESRINELEKEGLETKTELQQMGIRHQLQMQEQAATIRQEAETELVAWKNAKASSDATSHELKDEMSKLRRTLLFISIVRRTLMPPSDETIHELKAQMEEATQKSELLDSLQGDLQKRNHEIQQLQQQNLNLKVSCLLRRSECFPHALCSGAN